MRKPCNFRLQFETLDAIDEIIRLRFRNGDACTRVVRSRKRNRTYIIEVAINQLLSRMKSASRRE